MLVPYYIIPHVWTASSKQRMQKLKCTQSWPTSLIRAFLKTLGTFDHNYNRVLAKSLLVMAEQAVYAVVDKSKKKKKHDSSYVEMATAPADSPPVYSSIVDKEKGRNQTTPSDDVVDSDYTMITPIGTRMNANDEPKPPEIPRYDAVGDTPTHDKKSPEIDFGKFTIESQMIPSVSNKKFFCIILIVLLVFFLAFTGCIIAAFLELSALKSASTVSYDETDSMLLLQQLIINRSLLELDQRLREQEERTVSFLTTLVRNETSLLNETVYNFGLELKQNLTALQQQVSDSSPILTEVEVMELIEHINFGKSNQTPAASCANLLPSSPSGYYWVRSSNGSVVRVYCDMTLSCGGVTGGWMRVAELNVADTSQQCPPGLEKRTDGSIQSCELNATGCSPITYPTQNSYTKVCGRITAYQIGATNAFRRSSAPNSNTIIDSNYVDGVSLTHGISSRQHIWTFAAALGRTGSFNSPDSYCPCQNITQPSIIVPPFVGEDYFCDAGNEEFTDGETGLQTDPLWDGTDCLCCDNPPWFYKQLPQPTTDDIEMRVCRDEEASNEGIAVQLVEIYVQ